MPLYLESERCRFKSKYDLFKHAIINSFEKIEKFKIALNQSNGEIQTVASRSVPNFGLKSHPKDYHQKLTY